MKLYDDIYPEFYRMEVCGCLIYYYFISQDKSTLKDFNKSLKNYSFLFIIQLWE